jgi:hypothetical protein
VSNSCFIVAGKEVGSRWEDAMATTKRRVAVRLSLLAMALISVCARRAAAETEGQRKDDEQHIEHTIVVGVGGAAELELADGALHPGANVMVEWDAVEDWLEFEVEASVLSADHGTETPIGLAIKKPFHLARWAEVMVGVGPEVVYVSNPTTKGTFFGGQMVLDFMFWPTQRFGVWVEPSYDVIARNGVSHGIGSTGGFLVGW